MKEALRATRARFQPAHGEDIAGAKEAINALERRIGKFLEMASQLESAAPVVRKIDEIERERTALELKIAQWHKADEAAEAPASITEADVRATMRRLAKDMADFEPRELRDILCSILSGVQLDAEKATVQIAHRIPLVSRLSVASPGGFEPPYLP